MHQMYGFSFIAFDATAGQADPERKIKIPG